jgi:hypothetical protein
VISVRVDQDTYIRRDNSLTNQNENADPDNELLVGRNNNITDALRPMLGFNVSTIINDVNTLGGGDFANLTINSATLTIYERRELASDATLDVYSYDFSFTDSLATWNAPSSGLPADASAGGTLGTQLADNFALAWLTAGTDNYQSTISLSTAGFLEALQNSNVSGTLNLILRGDTGYNTNPEFSRSPATSRQPLPATHCCVWTTAWSRSPARRFSVRSACCVCCAAAVDSQGFRSDSRASRFHTGGGSLFFDSRTRLEAA